MWQHIKVIRGCNKRIRKYNKSIKEKEKIKTDLDNIIPEAKTCGYCNTDLKDNDIVNKTFKRRGGTSIHTFNCRFCFSKECF